jgi:hypothetical protein
MAFNDIELRRIDKVVGGFCRDRIPDHLLGQGVCKWQKYPEMKPARDLKSLVNEIKNDPHRVFWEEAQDGL